ncbi:MAG: hypothetical protein R8K21_03690 [Mariprofundales bacterium]
MRLQRHIIMCITDISYKYATILQQPITITENNAIASFQSLVNAINNSSLKPYLLIDEYDNFTNELMMGGGEVYVVLLKMKYLLH